MPRPVANALLYAGVWLLVLERLWLAVAFFAQDARFLLFQRRRLRQRIAELVRQHGALSSPADATIDGSVA